MSEMIPVNILIADRSYRLKIEAADEEMVRKTAGLINEKIAEFRCATKYSKKRIIFYFTNIHCHVNNVTMTRIIK